MEAATGQFLHAPVRTALRGSAVIFSVVLLASLFGILTRPVGFLAAFWPANAILLAVMVRNPALSTPTGWMAAFVGYVSADLMTGGGFASTLWLTGANMAGAMTGYVLFMRLAASDRRLERPFSIVCMFMICAMAAAVAAVVGSGAAHFVFDRDILTGFVFWFTTELVNSIIVLPVILTAPRWRRLWYRRREKVLGEAEWIPGAMLFGSIFVSFILSGPGAFAYPIPALLWCALTYSLFTTSILTLCFGVAQLVAVAIGLIPMHTGGEAFMDAVSIRLAIALICLGPLAVASINSARDELLRRIQHVADHDFLTGTLARSAFMKRGVAMLEKATQPIIALMIDLDHFKSVNDRHGHAIGDVVLKEASRAIALNIRTGDIIGRLGGEEFAALLKNTSKEEALIICERIRQAVANLAVKTPEGQSLHVTVSIGLATGEASVGKSLQSLLLDADKALYQAKSTGRNRVVTADETVSSPKTRTAA